MAFAVTNGRVSLNLTGLKLRSAASSARPGHSITLITRAASSASPEMRTMDPETSSSSVASSSSSSASTRTNPVVPSYRVSIFDAMKFTGPAPERVNARLAMLFFVIAAAKEHNTGVTLLAQLQDPDWGLLALAAVFVYATMVPVLKGVRDEDFFAFSVAAEKANGRLAMLGWAGLMALEELYAHACFF